ncbi:MAG: hypothetical protein ACO32J_08690, partial [Phycisphaerales bacterium]
MGERVGIAGDGQMALVLAAIAAGSGHDAAIWCPLPGQAAMLRATRRSERLADLTLPASVRVSEIAGEVLRDATVLVSAIPTQFARATWTRLAADTPAGVGMVTGTKGGEGGTGMRPTEGRRAAVGQRPMAVLSG